jgi:hypothetical protein
MEMVIEVLKHLWRGLVAANPAACWRARSPRPVLLLCLLGLAGCGKSGAPAGAERGACYGNGTCNAGLTCLSDLCVATAATGSAISTAMAKAEKYTNEICACAQNDRACAEAVVEKMRAETSEAEGKVLDRELKGSALEKKLERCMDRALPRVKKTEAALQLNKIGKSAKRVYSETSSFVVGTAAQLPRKPGSGGCCGSTGGAPNHCRADPAGFAADPVWRSLDFEIDEDSLFYYDYTGTATTFTAKATGDLDCDGTEIVYTLVGTAVNGNPTVQLIEPAVNAD